MVKSYHVKPELFNIGSILKHTNSCLDPCYDKILNYKAVHRLSEDYLGYSEKVYAFDVNATAI